METLGLEGSEVLRMPKQFPVASFSRVCRWLGEAEKQETHGKHALLIKFEQGIGPARSPVSSFCSGKCLKFKLSQRCWKHSASKQWHTRVAKETGPPESLRLSFWADKAIAIAAKMATTTSDILATCAGYSPPAMAMQDLPPSSFSLSDCAGKGRWDGGREGSH